MECLKKLNNQYEVEDNMNKLDMLQCVTKGLKITGTKKKLKENKYQYMNELEIFLKLQKELSNTHIEVFSSINKIKICQIAIKNRNQIAEDKCNFNRFLQWSNGEVLNDCYHNLLELEWEYNHSLDHLKEIIIDKLKEQYFAEFYFNSHFWEIDLYDDNVKRHILWK